MVGGHKKEDYPSKGDFSNFNSYKTKKKQKAVAVAMGLWERGYENSVKVTIMSVGLNNTKTDDEAISPPTFTTQSFHYEPRKRINHITRRKKKNLANAWATRVRDKSWRLIRGHACRTSGGCSQDYCDEKLRMIFLVGPSLVIIIIHQHYQSWLSFSLSLK